MIASDILFNLKKNKFSYTKFIKVINTSLKSQEISLNKIDCRTLILWGEKDRVIKPSFAYELQKEIKNSQVKIIKNANHAWCITKPELLADEVKKFIFT